uniref:Sodefrin-like factor n=1 Tax=Panagrolaimus sp. JU765 TaxID=591449 RepID=A0AC34R6Z7_9BILA
MLKKIQLACLWFCIAGSVQLQCFGGQTNETCKEGQVCYIHYSQTFESVIKQGCVNKKHAEEYIFFCSEDWCNDPSKYTDVTGELAQPGQLKCYSSTDETIGDLITCPSDSIYCIVEFARDSDYFPTKITKRFCGNGKNFDCDFMEKCYKNGCNNVTLRSCYYGVAKSCDPSFHFSTLSAARSKNCPFMFYPNVCVTRKLISSDNKTCVIHDCQHSDANHLFYFGNNPTAEKLVVKEGNITIIVAQCKGNNCNEPNLLDET